MAAVSFQGIILDWENSSTRWLNRMLHLFNNTMCWPSRMKTFRCMARISHSIKWVHLQGAKSDLQASIPTSSNSSYLMTSQRWHPRQIMAPKPVRLIPTNTAINSIISKKIFSLASSSIRTQKTSNRILSTSKDTIWLMLTLWLRKLQWWTIRE